MGLFGLFGKKKSDDAQSPADTSAQDKQQQFANYDQANSTQADTGTPAGISQAMPTPPADVVSAPMTNTAPTDTLTEAPATDHNDLTNLLSSSAPSVQATTPEPAETPVPTPPAENPALSPVEEPVTDITPAPEPSITEPVSAPTDLNPASTTDTVSTPEPTETPAAEIPAETPVTPAPNASAVPEPPVPDNIPTTPAPMQ